MAYDRFTTDLETTTAVIDTSTGTVLHPSDLYAVKIRDDKFEELLRQGDSAIIEYARKNGKKVSI